MTIPYIPGWWDTISQNAQRFAQQLPQSIEPGRVAEKRFKQLVQDNPMIMQQFANMTPEERAAYASAAGFNTVPKSLLDMPLGPEAQQRKFVADLSPDMQQRYRLGLAGLKPEEEYKKEAELNKINLDVAGLNRDVLRGQVKDINRASAIIERGQELYPDLKGINFNSLAADSWRGKEVDPNLINAVMANPGAKQLYTTALSVQQQKYEGDLRRQLANIRNPEEKRTVTAELIRLLQLQGNSIENQLQQLNTDRRNWESNFMNMNKPFPEMARIKELQDQLSKNTESVTKLYEQVGAGNIAVPGAVKPTSGSAGPVDPERMNRFRSLMSNMDFFGNSIVP